MRLNGSQVVSVFHGRFEHTIDAKGRVSIPAKYREVLKKVGGDTVVITSGLRNCLECFPVPEWDRFLEKLAQNKHFDQALDALKRVYVSGATECSLDRLGRVLVPQSLRQHARLQKNVIWTGSVKIFQLWDVDEWGKQLDRDREHLLSAQGQELLSKLEI